MRVKNDITPHQIYEKNLPQLSAMCLEDVSSGQAVFSIMASNIVEFMGAKWTSKQFDLFGQMAYGEYYWMNVYEIKLFEQKVFAKDLGYYKNGQPVAKVYGEMTPGVLSDWLKHFSELMLYERGVYNQNKKSDWVPPENPVSDEMFESEMQKLRVLLANRNKKDEIQEVRKKEADVQLRELKMRITQCERSGKYYAAKRLMVQHRNIIKNNQQ